jgi:hypothetical protein
MHGSVFSFGLPARFGDAGQFATVSLFPKTDPANLEKSEVAVLTTTKLTPIVTPYFELGFFTLLFYECLFCHNFPPLSNRFIHPWQGERLACG